MYNMYIYYIYMIYNIYTYIYIYMIFKDSIRVIKFNLIQFDEFAKNPLDRIINIIRKDFRKAIRKCIRRDFRRGLCHCHESSPPLLA